MSCRLNVVPRVYVDQSSVQRSCLCVLRSHGVVDDFFSFIGTIRGGLSCSSLSYSQSTAAAARNAAGGPPAYHGASVSVPGSVPVNNPGPDGGFPAGNIGSSGAAAPLAATGGGATSENFSAGESPSGRSGIRCTSSSSSSSGGGFTVRTASEAVGPVLVWHRTAGPEGGWVACQGSYTLVVTTSPAGMVVHELTVKIIIV